jgi:hypothetical protein
MYRSTTRNNAVRCKLKGEKHNSIIRGTCCTGIPFNVGNFIISHNLKLIVRERHVRTILQISEILF